ncbi:MAG: DUF3037 domain-containing protein, partial [Burkholderiales bacterium]|nr:DUF3037 domain-containing protein [Burkholderiales bacterium]
MGGGPPTPTISSSGCGRRALSWRRRSVPDPCSYDYAVIRVVPRVEREEFVNVGVIVSCPARRFLEARIELDEVRLAALHPALDLAAVRKHLASIPIICAGGDGAGPIGRLSQRERFHWLVAPRSTVIQTSVQHTGRCADPAAALERLLDTMVRPPRQHGARCRPQ